MTYISPDGAFGGPVRVALNQAAALARRGHEVTVYAGAPDKAASVSLQEGFELRTYPARKVLRAGGFASLVAPQLVRALRKDVKEFDVAHVHLARDLVTIPAARTLLRARSKYVVQPHGMIDASSNPLAEPLDRFATRPILRGALSVLALTDREMADIAEVDRSVRPRKIANGVRVGDLPAYAGRDDIVLFLARLHVRKRPMAFVEMARMLKDRLPTTKFVLVGPDEGEGPAVSNAIQASGMGNRLEWIGAVSPQKTSALMASARAYVLPSFNEVFPMTILEALQSGTPVVTTESLGIAAECRAFGAARVTDGSPKQLAESTFELLTTDGQVDSLRDGGLNYVRALLDIDLIAKELEGIYAMIEPGQP
ncbi:glycosyltransferase [Microbacter sp. GSS18]|nr:glycosyltransferase [Microbacter sp. GSS18]